MTQTSTEPSASAAALVAADWPLEEAVETVIAPVTRRLKLHDLFKHGDVVRILAIRDFKAKYKQSALGPIWLVFQPLALLAVFLVAYRGLGRVQGTDVPYVVFTLVGLSIWSFFQAGMTIGTACVITNAAFVQFTPCPRIAFPAAAMIASLPSFAITVTGALVAAAVTGTISPRAVLMPVVLVWLFLLTTSVVAISSSLAVRYRDMLSALPFILQLGLFVAPVGYGLTHLSPIVRTVIEINPVTGLIEAARWSVIAGFHPSITAIVLSLALTGLLATVGWLVFTKAETTMADVI